MRTIALSALLILLVASPAAADPVSLLTTIGGAFSKAAGAIFGKTLFGTVTVGQAIGTGLSALGAVTQRNRQRRAVRRQQAAAAIAEQQRQDGIKFELAQLNARPQYRFVYGETRSPGSPVFQYAKGSDLWMCYLVNSRPSAGQFQVRIDNRPVPLDGDPLDFAGAGAAPMARTESLAVSDSLYGGNPWLQLTPEERAQIATDDADILVGYAKVWIGLGDQTAPPTEVQNELVGILETTDAWRGRTIVWCKFSLGAKDEAYKRWPSQPPALELEGKFSKVFDPRIASHDVNDSATWAYSDTSALIALDCMLNNPVQGFNPAEVDLDSFGVAASLDERIYTRGDGTDEKMFATGGVVVFSNTEIASFVEPLIEAGGGEITRREGKLYYIASTPRSAEMTITDVVGDTLELDTLSTGRNIANTFVINFTAKSRQYEDSSLKDYSPGTSVAEDGGLPTRETISLPFVQSETQAMRLRKILVEQARLQKTIRCTLPHTFLGVYPGMVVEVALAGLDSANGLYTVESVSPTLVPASTDEAVAIRLDVVLLEYKSDGYVFNPSEEEEFERSNPVFSYVLGEDGVFNLGVKTGDESPNAPVTISFVAGTEDQATAITIDRRVAADANKGVAAASYETVQAVIPNGQTVNFEDTAAVVGQAYDYRLVTRKGAEVQRTDVFPNVIGLASTALLSPPLITKYRVFLETVTVGGGQSEEVVTTRYTTIEFRLLADANVTRVQIYHSNTDDFATAIPFTSFDPVASGEAYERTWVADGKTFIWAVAEDGGGNQSDPSISKQA